MSKKYEIYSGKRVVSIQESATPLQAAVDYVRSLGPPDAETRGSGSTQWRGEALDSPRASLLPRGKTRRHLRDIATHARRAPHSSLRQSGRGS